MTGQARGSADLRGLKALVTVLGVLVVLGTALVIGVVIKRLYAKPADPSISAAMPTGVPGEVSAAPTLTHLEPGEHIAGIAGAGGDFAIWVKGPSGDRILLLDPATATFSTVITQAP